jgi:hypothetical protein
MFTQILTLKQQVCRINFFGIFISHKKTISYAGFSKQDVCGPWKGACIY